MAVKQGSNSREQGVRTLRVCSLCVCALGTDMGVAQRLRLRPGSLACMHLLEYCAPAIYLDPSGALSLIQGLA